MSIVLRSNALLAFVACCVLIGVAQDTSGSQQQTNHAQMAQVSASALSGMVESKTLPQYPKEALMKGIQGDVTFKVVVDETGRIVSNKPIEGDALLVAASKEALHDYRFHPYVVNGAPVAFESEVGYRFTLAHTGDETHGKVECMTAIP
jgi:outer membrane biosynthesis protein TonB